MNRESKKKESIQIVSVSRNNDEYDMSIMCPFDQGPGGGGSGGGGC